MEVDVGGQGFAQAGEVVVVLEVREGHCQGEVDALFREEGVLDLDLQFFAVLCRG